MKQRTSEMRKSDARVELELGTRGGVIARAVSGAKSIKGKREEQ